MLLVVIAIAPVFAVVVQASFAEQRTRLERAQATLNAMVDLAGAHQERLVDGSRQVLAAIAYSPAVYGEDGAACADYMRRLQAQYPLSYGTFGMLDDRGNLACRSQAPAVAVNSSDRLFFRTAVATRRFSVGELTTSRASGKPVLTFGLPVYAEQGGAFRGVAYVALDVRLADAELRKLALSPETTLLVADRNGAVIASTGPRAAPVGSHLPEAFLREALAAGVERAGRGTGGDGGEWFYSIEPVGHAGTGGLFVAGLVSSEQTLAPSIERLQSQLGALLVITLVAAGVAWMFADRVVARPMSRLLARVEALMREEIPADASAGPPRLREFGELEVRFQGMARTLTQRAVQRDGALAEMAGQNRLLESVLESMAEGVAVLDSQGRFIHTNAAARRIMPGIVQLGRKKAPTQYDPVEWGVFDIDGVTPLPHEARPASRVLAGENIDDFQYVARGLLSGGKEKVIHGHARALVSPDGEQYGAVIVFSDVTVAYRADQTLKESERRYRTLFESNPHPMWVYDLETLRFLTVNDAAVAHYGYTREEFLAMTIKDIRPAEDVIPMLESLDEGGALHQPVPWRHRLRDGNLIYVEISSHTLDYGGRAARMVLAHDITQRRLAQQAMEQVNETLERRVAERTRELAVSNRELELFAYSVSHDLRAPLQAIDGFGRALLAHHADQLNERGRHFLDRIRENTSQMAGLIDDLLSLARVTRTEIRSERVDLAARARQLAERLRQRDPERVVEVEIEPELVCPGDPGLLGIVLQNLVENAWKFTARTEQAQIRIGSRALDDGELAVYVADNGAGFDMAYADKLFHAFQRLHAATDFEGTGIGLATVHRIVTRHGGRVWAESAPGRGATFFFTLKAGAPHEKQPDSDGRRQPGSPGTHLDDAGREQCPQ